MVHDGHYAPHRPFVILRRCIWQCELIFTFFKTEVKTRRNQEDKNTEAELGPETIQFSLVKFTSNEAKAVSQAPLQLSQFTYNPNSRILQQTKHPSFKLIQLENKETPSQGKHTHTTKHVYVRLARVVARVILKQQ